MTEYQPLTVQKAATMAGTSATTIKRKIHSGDLKATITPRGQYRIEHKELMTFLANQQQPPVRQGASMDEPPGRQDLIVQILERELAQTKERLRSLEERNERLQSEMLSLMAELKEALTGKGKGGLSAWFSKVRGM